MTLGTVTRLSVGSILALLAASTTAQTQPDSNLPGKAVYDKSCATCHAAPVDERTPKFAALTALPAGQMRDAMGEGGKMAPMAAALSDDEKGQLIAYLTSGQKPVAGNWIERSLCAADKRAVDVTKPVIASGFGVDANLSRNLSAQQAGIKKAELKNLEVAWVLGFPGQGSATGAAIVGDTAFVNGGGQLLAIDTGSGCVKWAIAATSRNTPTFGDLGGRKVVALSVARDVLVVDAKSGEKIWQVSGQAEGNAGSVRGGVIIYKDRVIVPISASGIGAAMQPNFECCVGHGAVVALAGKDGSKLWEYHTMPAAQYNGRVSVNGVKQRGPSGAPIWSMPTIDAKRNRVLVTTGENTSHPGTETSDAVIAVDLESGKEVWKYQATAKDLFNMACRGTVQASGPNCPGKIDDDMSLSRDFDFGAGAILAQGEGGKDVVLAGQKSGDAWALDAETGKLLWNVRFGKGTALGGVHWGITTDGERLFVPINDPRGTGGRDLRPGIFAVDIKTGKQAWGYDAKPNCDGERGKLANNCNNNFGFSAAPLTIDGAVVGGTMGGEVVILDGKSGDVLAKLDTLGPKQTINGVEAKGGAIESHGISAGSGMLFVNSGYALFGATRGNALIAYRPKKS